MRHSPKEGRPGDNTRIRMLVNESLKNKINTAQQICWVLPGAQQAEGRKKKEILCINEVFSRSQYKINIGMILRMVP